MDIFLLYTIACISAVLTDHYDYIYLRIRDVGTDVYIIYCTCMHHTNRLYIQDDFIILLATNY